MPLATFAFSTKPAPHLLLPHAHSTRRKAKNKSYTRKRATRNVSKWPAAQKKRNIFICKIVSIARAGFKQVACRSATRYGLWYMTGNCHSLIMSIEHSKLVEFDFLIRALVFARITLEQQVEYPFHSTASIERRPRPTPSLRGIRRLDIPHFAMQASELGI